MRVVAFTPYPIEGPASRFRLFQFVDPLRERGIELEIRSFFDSESFRGLYTASGSGGKMRALIKGIRSRIQDASKVRAGDVIIVHSELAPTMGGVVLDRLLSQGARIVYNFDDSVFLKRPGGSRLIRMLARPDRRTADLCRAASAVMAGNRYLASYAERARGGPDHVHVMPTVLDTERFRPATDHREQRRRREDGRRQGDRLPTVGWIGTHSTLPYLTALFPALAAVQARREYRLRVICNRAPEPFPGLKVEFIEWALEDELRYFEGLDVGLYPVPDDAWTRGKCGFKAIQYLACGIPTIASPVGVLSEIARDGETGLHASDPMSWEVALERLLENEGLRAEMGVAGRRLIVERYSIQAVVEEFAETLRAVA